MNYTGGTLFATSYYLPRAYNGLLGGAFVMLPKGRAYSRCFVCRSIRPEHISKSIEGNLMKLDTLIDGHEGNCIMQEP